MTSLIPKRIYELVGKGMKGLLGKRLLHPNLSKNFPYENAFILMNVRFPNIHKTFIAWQPFIRCQQRIKLLWYFNHADTVRSWKPQIRKQGRSWRGDCICKDKINVGDLSCVGIAEGFRGERLGFWASYTCGRKTRLEEKRKSTSGVIPGN